MVQGHVNRLEAVSENLVHANMPGYRRLHSSNKIFDTLLKQAESEVKKPQPEHYDPIEVDFTPGPLQTTGRSLDFAVTGDAFFVLEEEGRTFYSRNGHFLIGADRVLRNTGGLTVSGQQGEITIPAGTRIDQLNVGDDGTIRADGAVVGKLKLASFEDNGTLQRVGPTLFSAPETQRPAEEPREGVVVVNRALEGSNTTIFMEMAEMVTTMRAFEAAQKIVTAGNEVEQRMIQEFGR